jgi:hypothetical protein
MLPRRAASRYAGLSVALAPSVATRIEVATRGVAMLADIYNWFIQGFDTADLKGARRC